jgi:hypothetical protein
LRRCFVLAKLAVRVCACGCGAVHGFPVAAVSGSVDVDSSILISSVFYLRNEKYQRAGGYLSIWK